MKVVPQAFFQDRRVDILLADGLCAVIRKRVDRAGEQQERYLSAHAVTLVHRGTLRISTSEGELLHVPEGQLILLPKGLYMVTDLLPETGVFEALVCFLDDELISAFPAGASPDPAVAAAPFVSARSPEVRLFFDNLLALYDDGTQAHHSLTRPKLLEFLHLLSRGPDGEQVLAHLRGLQRREKKSLAGFMEANFHKPLRIADFAALTGRSASTFYRDFKVRFGCGPKQWLIDRRLELAERMLRAGQGGVEEVASAVGYDNVPHFIKSFRRKFGQSPGQFAIAARSEAVF